jgi:hypothetical protein
MGSILLLIVIITSIYSQCCLADDAGQQRDVESARLALARVKPLKATSVTNSSFSITYSVNGPDVFDVRYRVLCVPEGVPCLGGPQGDTDIVAESSGLIPASPDPSKLKNKQTFEVSLSGFEPGTDYRCYTEASVSSKMKICDAGIKVTTGPTFGVWDTRVITAGVTPTSWTGSWSPPVSSRASTTDSTQVSYAASCVPRGTADPSVYPAYLATDPSASSATVPNLEPLGEYSCTVQEITKQLVLVSDPVNVTMPGTEPQCIGVDDQGNPRPVDWFVMIKQPAGWDYVYVDNIKLESCTNASDCWYYPPKDKNLFTSSSPVAFTLQYAADAEANEQGYMYYNDQPPIYQSNINTWTSGSCSNNAHAKTVLAFGETQGYVLDHSSPAFPLPQSGLSSEFPFYWLGAPQACLAQHFGCFSFNSTVLNSTISSAVYNMKAYVYDINFPTALQATYPTLYAATRADLPDKYDVFYGETDTQGEQSMKIVSKPMCYSDQSFSECSFGIIQDNYTTPYLNQTMYWMSFYSVYSANETFASQDPIQGACPANASTPWLDSLNILNVSFPGRPDTINSYDFSRDHAKWGVSADDSTVKYACVGDMNRAGQVPKAGQPRRGGAFYCLQNDLLWSILSDSVVSIEPCGVGPTFEDTDFDGCPNSSVNASSLILVSDGTGNSTSSASTCKRYYNAYS